MAIKIKPGKGKASLRCARARITPSPPRSSLPPQVTSPQILATHPIPTACSPSMLSRTLRCGFDCGFDVAVCCSSQLVSNPYCQFTIIAIEGVEKWLWLWLSLHSGQLAIIFPTTVDFLERSGQWATCTTQHKQTWNCQRSDQRNVHGKKTRLVHSVPERESIPTSLVHPYLLTSPLLKSLCTSDPAACSQSLHKWPKPYSVQRAISCHASCETILLWWFCAMPLLFW